MKKETFVNFMKLCESYYNKCNKFGESISKAYLEAGLDRDFASQTSYAFPSGPLIDQIVKIISAELSDDNYTSEQAEDFINWWMWECNFGKAVLYEYVDGGYGTSPAAEVTLTNGKSYVVKTPGQLYDVIMKDKKICAYKKA